MLSRHFLVCNKETNVVVATHWTKKGAMKQAKKKSHSENEAGKYIAVRAKLAYHIGDICPLVHVEKIFSYDLKRKHDALVQYEKLQQIQRMEEQNAALASAYAGEQTQPVVKKTRKPRVKKVEGQ